MEDRILSEIGLSFCQTIRHDIPKVRGLYIKSGVDGRIILKWTLEKWDGRAWTG
jgi:hypothetical protein